MILGMILTKFLVKLGASIAINVKTLVKIDLRALFPCVYIHHLDQRLVKFRTSDSRSE